MITNKHINKIIICLVILAIVFTGIFVLNPGLLEIQSEASAPEYAEKLFPEDAVITINITADQDKWDEMLENATAEEYIPCDITINGETFYSVGIRPKGNSSLQTVARDDNTDRYSFKIKMDEYVDGQTYYGLSKFVLNNMQGDATYMKEYLSYDMFKYLGVSTPLYAFADISLNGEPWGFYLAIETEEEDFAQRNFGSDFGELYKPESVDMGGGQGGGQNQGAGQGQEGNQNQGAGPNQDGNNAAGGPPDRGGNTSGGAIGFNGPGNGGPPDRSGSTSGGAMGFGNQRPDGMNQTSGGAVNAGGPMNGGFGGGGSGGGADLVYSDDETSSYSQIFDNAVSKVSDSDKTRVIKALKALSDGEDLGNYIDVDEVARYFAANTALVNLDSYVSSLKHNYYLYEDDGKLSILPWDLNLSFAGFQSSSADSAVNFPIDTPVSGVTLDERPLVGLLFDNDEYTELYHSYLQKLVDGYFNSGHFEETIERLNALISDHVKNDASAFYTYDQYQSAVEALKEFGTLRAQSIEGQLNGTVPSTSEAQAADSSSLIDASGLSLSAMGSQGNGGGADRGNGGGADRGNENQTDQGNGTEADQGNNP